MWIPGVMNRQNGKVDNTGIMFAMVVLDRANAVKGEFIGVYRNAIINVERERAAACYN